MSDFRWNKYPDVTPVSGTRLDRRHYLVEIAHANGDGSFYMVLEYADGWNCFVNIDGTINKKNKMHNIISWAEIPPNIER